MEFGLFIMGAVALGACDNSAAAVFFSLATLSFVHRKEKEWRKK
jgi:hypothetical protein